jgi:hypothetical protein
MGLGVCPYQWSVVGLCFGHAAGVTPITGTDHEGVVEHVAPMLELEG